jgi:hypothetical protein
MKHSSITKYNKFFIGGLLMYLIPTLIVILVSYNVVDSNEPKGPFDPNKGVVEPVLIDSISEEPKKPIKKKTKTLTSQNLEQKKVEIVSPTSTLVNLTQKDSLPN